VQNASKPPGKRGLDEKRPSVNGVAAELKIVCVKELMAKGARHRAVNRVVGVKHKYVVRLDERLRMSYRNGSVVAEISPWIVRYVARNVALAKELLDDVLGVICRASVRDNVRCYRHVGENVGERLGDDVRLVLDDHVEAYRWARHGE
jgi:hypothetical protein